MPVCPQCLEIVAREVQTQQNLVHPNICALLEVMNDKRQNPLCLVMELCEGGDLMREHCEPAVASEDPICRYTSSLLADAGPGLGGMSLAMARHFARQLCAAVGHMHERGVIHRDLKVPYLLLRHHPLSST